MSSPYTVDLALACMEQVIYDLCEDNARLAAANRRRGGRKKKTLKAR